MFWKLLKSIESIDFRQKAFFFGFFPSILFVHIKLRNRTCTSLCVSGIYIGYSSDLFFFILTFLLPLILHFHHRNVTCWKSRTCFGSFWVCRSKNLLIKRWGVRLMPLGMYLCCQKNWKSWFYHSKTLFNYSKLSKPTTDCQLRYQKFKGFKKPFGNSIFRLTNPISMGF